MLALSRFMQIRIRLEPAYRPKLDAHFPRLARVLEELGVKANPQRVTLYDLVGELERASEGQARSPVCKALQKHLHGLVKLRDLIREKLARWEPEGLDGLLYKLEDLFQDLEGDLD